MHLHLQQNSAEPTRKGRYGPLTIIIPRIGATKILQLQPKFVEESLKAMAFSRSLCGAIGSALGLFWSTMKMECDECSCSDQGQRLWQAAWAPDFIHGMCSEDQNLRRAIYLYALPALISVDKSVVDILLAEVAKMPKYISVRFFVTPTIEDNFLFSLSITFDISLANIRNIKH